MAPYQHTVGDTGKIDFDCFCANVDEHDLVAYASRFEHHLKVVLAGKCRLDGKTLLVVQQLLRNLKSLPACRDRGRGGNRRLDRPGYSIRIKDREGRKNVRIAAGQRALTGTIRASDEGEGGTIHRDVAGAG